MRSTDHRPSVPPFQKVYPVAAGELRMISTLVVWCLIMLGCSTTTIIPVNQSRLPSPYMKRDGHLGIKEAFGYVSADGNVLVPFEYDEAEPFTEGMGVVSKSGAWGYVNTQVQRLAVSATRGRETSVRGLDASRSRVNGGMSITVANS